MARKFGMFGILMAAMALSVSPTVSASAGMAPIVQKNCAKCHQNFSEMKNVMAGNVSSKAMKAHSIQMKINNRLEMVKFTPETEVSNLPELKLLKSGMAVRVHYEMVGSDRVAKKIVVKPKIKVPPEQLIEAKELVKLVEQGPEKGGYTLVDSRPGPGYLKGHIPTAISIPFPKMKDMLDKLPKEKDSLVIFYCQGYR